MNKPYTMEQVERMQMPTNTACRTLTTPASHAVRIINRTIETVRAQREYIKNEILELLFTR